MRRNDNDAIVTCAGAEVFLVMLAVCSGGRPPATKMDATEKSPRIYPPESTAHPSETVDQRRKVERDSVKPAAIEARLVREKWRDVDGIIKWAVRDRNRMLLET
jgi:hypothetical protein